MFREYTVKSGDTLYGISKQFGVEVIDIYNLNNLKSNTLQINQVLKIPNKDGDSPDSFFEYTVKRGDSLWNIAKLYQTTVDKIKEYNNLKSDVLSIGQKLMIPEVNTPVYNKPEFISYTVKRGDSLYSISKTYGISVDQIMKDNALKSNILAIGQVLDIRIKEKTDYSYGDSCYGSDYTPPAAYKTYTVKRGDSLWSIANKYNTSVDSIKKKNNLNSNTLSIGQVLKI